MALSLGSPPPEVIRHRLSMEPGLSSPNARASGAAARPADPRADAPAGPSGSRVRARYQVPVFSIDFHGSCGSLAPPFWRISMEMPSGDFTKAM